MSKQKTNPPRHFDAQKWLEAYDEEVREIYKHSQEARRDLFNADFPAPWTGAVTLQSSARFAAICDLSARRYNPD